MKNLKFKRNRSEPPVKTQWPIAFMSVAVIKQRMRGYRPHSIINQSLDREDVVRDATIRHIDKPAICNLLNQCLADCLDLQSQCQQALWHLRSSDCVEQRFACAQAVQLIGHHIQFIGDRIRKLGGIAEWTAARVAARSGLCTYPVDASEPRDHIDAIAFGFWLVRTVLSEDKALIDIRGDVVSRQLLTQIIELMTKLYNLIEEGSSIAEMS